MGLKSNNNLTILFLIASLNSVLLFQLSFSLGLLYFVVVLLAALIIREGRKNYGVLEQSGIPVIEPTLFLGSEPNIHKTVLHLADIERFNKYGPIWGSYIGRTPHLFITDPELIRLIFVKDFSTHFGDRQDFEFGCQIMNELFEFKKGEEWKTLRTFLSPLFTTSKIKQMSEVIAESAQEFATDLRSECGENGRVKIDCRRRFTTCLIDMFARTTIGVRVEDSKNPDNNFAQAFRAMMFEDMEQNWLFSLSLSFPILQKIAPTFMDEPTKLLASTFTNVIKNRIESGTSSTKDFLDLLCDLWKRVEAGEFKELGFTETTVLAQCVLFFLGGYETTASMLSSFLWNIANHPEVQVKMNKELEQALSNNPNIEHELISESNIPYISACINETLRLQPSFYRPERICGKDWSHNGFSIKKGTVVMIPTWAANRNPKYFPDEPEKFKPERFLPENKGNNEPYAFTSFGFGPRSCIGVELRSDSVLEYKPCAPFVIGFKPLYLDLVARNK